MRGDGSVVDHGLAGGLTAGVDGERRTALAVTSGPAGLPRPAHRGRLPLINADGRQRFA
jgi:hypothetical protein